MRIQAKIQRWGNGLALRVAGVMRDIPQFQEGMEVEVDIDEEGFTVKKAALIKKVRLPFSESQLLDGLTPGLAHADSLITPSADELGE